jgi:hypothetical protein
VPRKIFKSERDELSEELKKIYNGKGKAIPVTDREGP